MLKLTFPSDSRRDELVTSPLITPIMTIPPTKLHLLAPLPRAYSIDAQFQHNPIEKDVGRRVTFNNSTSPLAKVHPLRCSKSGNPHRHRRSQIVSANAEQFAPAPNHVMKMHKKST
jgi:hypothetical protein